MHENGCPWDASTCSTAASSGHLDCLIYAHEQGCPWDHSTCTNSAASGQLSILQYAFSHGCPWNKQTTEKAARNGHLDCLVYAHKNGCLWDKRTTEQAAGKGHPSNKRLSNCLQYLYDADLKVYSEQDCELAAKRGDLERLKYLHEKGCKWNKYSSDAAAKMGHLTCRHRN